MPIIYMVGNEGTEQAIGATLYNGSMQIYALKRSDPLNMIYIGGHRISDAPTYNTTEGIIIPEYVFRNGRNVVVERQITGDIVKSVTFNLLLPNKAVSVTDRIYQLQNKCDYDVVFVPRNCGVGCDTYFWYGRDMKLGAKQATSGIVGFDDTEGAITMQRTLKVSGNLLQFNGMQIRQLTAQATGVALYSVLVVDDEKELCQGCECPYQRIYRGGGDGVAAPVLEVSENGGVTWTPIVTTALGVGNIITALAYVDGRLVVGYSDVADADGTAGGVGYVNAAGVAVVAPIVTPAGGAFTSLGVQSLVYTGTAIWSFGTSGEINKSCDGGLTWTNFPQTEITATILDAAYDNTTGNFFLAAEDAQAWNFNGALFKDHTLDVDATAAVDLVEVMITAPDGVLFAGADGNTYESFAYSEGDYNTLGTGDKFAQTAALGASVAGAAGDNANVRTVVGAGNQIWVRDPISKQTFVELGTVVGDVMQLREGAPLQDEGYNYFVGVTDAGETFVVSQCNICLSGGC